MFDNIFGKLKESLKKTKDIFTDQVNEMLNLTVTIDDEMYEELEELLILSDIGASTSDKIIEMLRQKVREQKINDPRNVKDALKEVIIEILGEEKNSFYPDVTPKIYLIIGVNGVGKTTTIGKLSRKLRFGGYKVIIAAADTFRAAAIDQIVVWAERAGVEIIKQEEGSDPAAVIFDAISASKARSADVLICDTAGRLHNKKNLMEELGKINKIVEREYVKASKETLLVLDATTGQNAITQAKQFMDICSVDGIILTKLDGTAKGGIVISIKDQLNIPVKYICVGEKIEDIQEFNARDFAEALF